MAEPADAGTDEVRFDLLRPDPGGTVQSLAALGYSPAAAVADLVDNSIAAGATTVAIDVHWGGAANSMVSVRDDGRGMDETGLLRGMTVGGRGLDTDRTAADLGRFGMGLKTASFAQSRELVVATRTDGGPWMSRTWDIDHVLRVRDWQLLHRPSTPAADRLQALTADHHGSGTVVLWRRLTQLVAADSRAEDDWAQAEFHKHVREIETHLGMIFSRYLTRRRSPLRLTLNGHPVQAWDPFLAVNPWVEPLAAEHPLVGVKVQGFVLPHPARFDDAGHDEAGGPRGWLDQQGFYIYRQDRLIVAGGWLGLGFRRDERHRLARIAVDVGTGHDSEWSVDVRKSSAVPPAALAGHLRRIARATRERAAAVISHRGKIVREKRATSHDATWTQVSRLGERHFRINRSHPLLVDLLARHPDVRPAVSALLGMIEATLPVDLIRISPDPAPATTATATGNAPESLVDMAGEVLEALVGQGSNGPDALARVLAMPPFDTYPGLAGQLTDGSS